MWLCSVRRKSVSSNLSFQLICLIENILDEIYFNSKLTKWMLSKSLFIRPFEA